MGDSVELEIRIVGAGGLRHHATVARGPSQVGGSGYFELPESGSLLAGGSGEWRDLRRRADHSDTALFRLLNDQGRALFDLVFVGELYAAFLRSYELARSEDRWFRLQLSFDHAPVAMDQPWEALVFSREGHALALLKKVSIERRLITAPAMEMPRLPDSGRLRALVAGASPSDLDKIDVRAERNLIKNELRKRVTPEILEHTSLSSLGKALIAKDAGFDLIHFIGHGDFAGDEGGIWLEDERGGGLRLTGRELPAMLRQPVSFVFLNICHGGRSSPNPFAGIAEALLRSGVRAVVAMRREVTDSGAVALAKSFYSCLARGDSLSQALAKARSSVVNAQYGDWAVPMLYLAGEDFSLLPPAVPMPLGELLGPKLDTCDASAISETPSSPRPLLSVLGEKAAFPARQIGIGGLVLVVAALGSWIAVRSTEEPAFSAQTPDTAPPTVQEAEAAPPADAAAAKSDAALSDAPKSSTDMALDAAKSLPLMANPRAESSASASKTSPASPDENARRCPSPPGIPIEFIFVPAGKPFRQGEDRGDKELGPQHQVTLTRDYCLAKLETTRGLWARVHGWEAPPASEAKLPRSYVTKDDTRVFLQRLDQLDRTGQYRLPTESEWEYAARAGTTSLFSFGDERSSLPLYGNCLQEDRPRRAMPVGSLKANPWGFHDMHGNVWEWVEDDWTSYAADDSIDPLGRNPRANPVRRGGAYDSKAENCWSAARKDLGVSKMKTVGFRIVRTPVR